MKKKEVMHLHENMFGDIAQKFLDAEQLLPLNHPVRVELSNMRLKLGNPIKMNRQISNIAQTFWVYMVESEAPL